MLEQVLDFIHNYFEKDIYTRKFKIESGSLVDAVSVWVRLPSQPVVQRKT